MNFPRHLMTRTANIRFTAGYAQDNTGRAVPSVDTEWQSIPCRIEAMSADESMQYGSEVGTIRYRIWFPSAQVAFDEEGIADFNVPAKARVELDDMIYRIVGPGVTHGTEDHLQECQAETENQEIPGE